MNVVCLSCLEYDYWCVHMYSCVRTAVPQQQPPPFVSLLSLCSVFWKMIRAFIIVFAIVAFGDLMHRAVFWVNFVQPVKTIFADIIGNVAKFIITEKKKVESHQETETKNKKQNQLDS